MFLLISLSLEPGNDLLTYLQIADKDLPSVPGNATFIPPTPPEKNSMNQTRFGELYGGFYKNVQILYRALYRHIHLPPAVIRNRGDKKSSTQKPKKNNKKHGKY